MVERPEQYRWGSYRAHAGYETAPPWLASNQLLEHFAPDRHIAQGLYRTFIDEKIGDKHRIWDDLVGQIYLGSQRWIETMRERVESKPRSDDHPRPQREIGRPQMPTIVAAVAQAFETSENQIRKRGAHVARRGVAGTIWGQARIPH